MTELEVKPRKTPWGVVLAALAVFVVGSWVLWDMKPWIKEVPTPKPASTVKILGRDDAVTKKAEAELDNSASSRPASSASAAPAKSAAPASSH